MRVVAIGDIGVLDGMLHIGDEAMFEALVGELRERGATRITALSVSPAESAARYGVEAIDRIGFDGSRAAMHSRLEAIGECLDGRRALPAEDPVWSVIEAVGEADLVVIAGGGNLASTWPLHIFERLALSRIAARSARPLVITGQTLGPRIDPDDRPMLGELLRSATVVGLREPASDALAAELGVADARRRLGCDDASFLGFDATDRRADDATGRPIVVSLSTHLGALDRDTAVSGLARALDRLAEHAGAPVIFHPHFAAVDPARRAGDEVLHDALMLRMTASTRSLEPGDAVTAARLARSASMMVTSRYHPAVFAGPAGVQIAALSADEYTSVKLRGATGWWGQHGVLELADAARPSGGDALTALWDRRQASLREADERRDAAIREAAAWWDRVVAAGR